jgi:hypothetical protein
MEARDEKRLLKLQAQLAAVKLLMTREPFDKYFSTMPTSRPGWAIAEVFPEPIVAAAALDAIRVGAISFDAVKQLIIAKIERRPANLDLGDYPHLPVANVKTTSAADYAVLVSGRAA